MNQPIDILMSFDTTGSMYPCIGEVRSEVEASVRRLFSQIPELHIGIIAHGDYCDARTAYVTRHLPFTNDVDTVANFVRAVPRTFGGDAEECYELVLREAQGFNWRAGSKRVLVLIGDDVPHGVAHNPWNLDWKTELDACVRNGIMVHGVQCLRNYYADTFYATLAAKSGGAHLTLGQFHEATRMMMAIAYQQQSPEAFKLYEEEIEKAGGMTRTMADIFDKLCRRDKKTGRYQKVDARAVATGRFQIITVDQDIPIKQLVENKGLMFKTGRGFYEFTKKETIQGHKEIILLDIASGDMYQGDAAREVLGLSKRAGGRDVKGNVDIKPDYDRSKYKVFVQSTSVNRKLLKDTLFLYEAFEATTSKAA